ncbi:NACHT domain-containing protein [Dactylosporangium sp. NPDC000555]|uniref:NACHT domain-containing protein n=1 Tax=Dactylosporangium sp. NPDC000555 TaxID=3154260 RepID=UPI003328423E
MSGIEVAIVGIGAAVVKSAAKLWLGDRALAAEVAASAIDALAGRATGLLQRKKVERTFDDLADTVAERVQVYVEREFRRLPKNERLSVLEAVRSTVERAPLDNDDLFAKDLNAAYVDRHLRGFSPDAERRAGLSADGAALYDMVLRDCCEYIVQVIIALPAFGPNALVEVLRRESEIAAALEDVLRRLPQRGERRAEDFETDYRRQVVNVLDEVELFGADVATRRYPLSVAYISLSMAASETGPDAAEGSPVSIERALANWPRIFVRGEAGGGKTTLLQWVAVRAALRELPELAGLVPLFIPLRRYVDKELPLPERFLGHVGRHIADEMPASWVHDLLRHGAAVVLVDGVDELPDGQRDEARRWLGDLVAIFPEARFVITSRPGAAPPDWLEKQGFVPYDLRPMSSADVDAFVRYWHAAVGAGIPDRDERLRLDELADRLRRTIPERRHLRLLAESPLLCALICALHRDRKGQLPENRVELYNVALDMLLQRRDNERSVVSALAMSRTDKTQFLQDIAYWLVRNGRSDAERGEVVEALQRKLLTMVQIRGTAEQIYAYLLERSGLLREPVVGRVDFVHLTFQEHLAALGVLSSGDLGLLLASAHLDQWREVVIMAVGNASSRDREKIMRGLLARAEEERDHREQMVLLAFLCLETAPELAVDVREAVEQLATEILPPKTVRVGLALAAAGPSVLDPLRRVQPTLIGEVVATIRTAAEIGGPEAMQLIGQWGADRRATVVDELLLAWHRFDREEYAAQVLRNSPLHGGHLVLDDPAAVPFAYLLCNLRSLDVRTPEAPKDLDFVARCTGIRELRTAVSPRSELRSLGRLERLERLSLARASNEFLGRDGVALPSVTTLGVSWFQGPVDVADIGRVVPNVLHLVLEDVQFVDRRVLKTLPRRLRTLSLRNTDAVLGPEIVEYTDLEFLDLGGIGQIDDANLRLLATLPNLYEVSLFKGSGSFDVTPLRQRGIAVTTSRKFGPLRLWRRLPYWTRPPEFETPASG